MRLRLWPRTLVVQLICVTAAAVVVSNIGVAIYFERANLAQFNNYLSDRMIDRTTAVATTMREISPQSRAIVMRTMGTGNWKFSQIPGPVPSRAMTDEETTFARRVIDGLPANYPDRENVVIIAHIDPQTVAQAQRPHRNEPGSDAVQVFLPLDGKTTLSALFLRPPPGGLPQEIMVATGVSILLVSLIAALMARRVARPLSELARAASVGATSGGVVPRVPETGPEDVRAAASAFNAMTEKVAKTLESQRHLLSAVGHDLRTPITAMRINLEFVTDEDLREGLERNLDELQDLTEQVLGAAKGTGGETRRNVDLSALVESLCTDLDEMGQPVTWAMHDAAPISCRPNEIRRAVRNLVENAVAYGGEADVKIADTPGAYEIVVEDRGPGIPEADHQRVFEPFVRLETSRNREGGGTGLGLTLVKAIAEGHGGQITLENKPDGGLRARMKLPRMAVPA
jgi:signal transduction histidine kinase